MSEIPVIYYPQILSDTEADELFRRIFNLIPNEADEIKAQQGTGKQVKEKRLTLWFSTNGRIFNYSGKTMKMNEPHFPEWLENVRQKVIELVKCNYDSVLINFYINQFSAMGWHKDPLFNENGEQIWEDDTTVISLGETRKFQVRYNSSNGVVATTVEKPIVLDQTVNSGDAVRMYTGCQREYDHRVCVSQKMKASDRDASLIVNENHLRISMVWKKSKIYK